MKTILLRALAVSMLLTYNFLAKAQEMASTETTAMATTASPETPATTEEEKESPFEIGGFVDAYYLYGFNKVPFTTSFTDQHNSFSLGMANLVLSKTGKFGFVADLGFGPRAEAANGYVDENGKISSLSLIKQLYVSYTPADWVTLTFGNFSTFVGYEVIDAPGNMNYSTSYMFTNGPFYHTGLKANFKLSEKLGAMAGIFNDTDTKIDVVPGKHFGAQLSYAGDKLAVYLNYLEGKQSEATEDEPEVFSHQVDITATFAASDKVGLGLNTAYRTFVPDKGSSTAWFGTALYANFAVSDATKIAVRGEYIADSDGVITGVADNSIMALTLSGHIEAGPFTFIPEFRVDSSSKDGYFADSDGNGKKSNAGVLFAVIYKF